ncbi:rhodanese-like domain-containing protein [Dolichospermum sp. UHCC 0684]|uniref:rhodanese-like domain-containing protein n=1 Tax=unclassified Dolichospermum TaxID=2622029 RepID=UPI001445E263|nr:MULTISPECIES: rhodanese-like domain-containing protein [unclassified Dolichospermum]MEA5531127.1 rhodanese-like domain-containing protein [Dolichospermum sp. UHCC 0684]MTJ36979.1 rhodanese-related sulfurtransferase [Dolichospermum sp. UHCC 0260]
MTNTLFDQPFSEITVEELAKRLSSNEGTLQLIDVREPQEIALSRLDGFVNLPLSEYEQWSEQVPIRFDIHAETLVLCHHGIRSAQMCGWLVTQGFTNVKNIKGGISAYSILVDPSVPQY